jgi:hypothetical protein
MRAGKVPVGKVEAGRMMDRPPGENNKTGKGVAASLADAPK